MNTHYNICYQSWGFSELGEFEGVGKFTAIFNFSRYKFPRLIAWRYVNNKQTDSMELISNPKVKAVFNNYPNAAQQQLLHLRALVLSVASEIEGLEKLEETLKWGEPSYLTKHGSTIRMDWKEKNPEQYAIYFKCTSRLVPTFKTIYKNKFKFEGNRAIVFELNDNIPIPQLKHCISMALTYHKIKHLPLLGA